MTRDRHTNNLKHGLLITEHLQNNTEIFIETLLTIYIKCIKQSPCNMSLMLLVLSLNERTVLRFFLQNLKLHVQLFYGGSFIDTERRHISTA